MKKLNYFTKTVVIVLAIAAIAFIASIFVYPSLDNLGNTRDDISAHSFLMGFLFILPLIVMLIVKKWRRFSFIPLSILIGSLIVTAIFEWDGIHFKKNLNLDESIQKACMEYCIKEDVRIDPCTLSFIKKEIAEENRLYRDYRCTFTAEIPDEGFDDTVMFYFEIDKYNRDGHVYDSYRVLSTSNKE